jgi:AmpD protein
MSGTAPDGAGAVDAAGWLSGARRVESPHQDERPPGCAIELLVVHAISLPPGVFGGDAIERLFTGRLDPAAHPYYARLRGLRVSSHFLVARDGALTQFVACRRRAWHAGRSSWEGRPACNDCSVGVELEGSEFEPYTEAQYRSLARLQQALCAAYPIRAARGHDEIAPGRKFDPGPLFDWSRIVRDGRAA